MRAGRPRAAFYIACPPSPPPGSHSPGNTWPAARARPAAAPWPRPAGCRCSAWPRLQVPLICCPSLAFLVSSPVPLDVGPPATQDPQLQDQHRRHGHRPGPLLCEHRPAARARPTAHHGSPFGLPVLAANLASSNPDLDHPLFLVTGGRASSAHRAPWLALRAAGAGGEPRQQQPRSRSPAVPGNRWPRSSARRAPWLALRAAGAGGEPRQQQPRSRSPAVPGNRWPRSSARRAPWLALRAAGAGGEPRQQQPRSRSPAVPGNRWPRELGPPRTMARPSGCRCWRRTSPAATQISITRCSW